MEALGLVSGASYGRAINNRGQVAGWGGIPRGGVVSFRYTDEIGIHALGELPGPNTGAGGIRESVASGINDMGQVVGWACIHDELGGCDVRHGFLYTDGWGMVDLNALIPSGSDWILASASDINNRGQIVGSGLLNGQDRAFLLTPIPEPGSGVLLAAAGFVVLGVWAGCRLLRVESGNVQRPANAHLVHSRAAGQAYGIVKP